MIAQFVDDLLLAIGEASIDELRELFASRPDSIKPLSVVRAAIAAPAPPSPPPPRAKTPRRWSAPVQLSLGVAEITNPEGLLSLDSSTPPAASAATALDAAPSRPERERERPVSASASRSPVVVALPTRIALASEPEGESPASGVRPVNSAPTVRLSDNETLARVSNAGVVIRRKKKA